MQRMCVTHVCGFKKAINGVGGTAMAAFRSQLEGNYGIG
jgi:hypothetical protein